MKTTLYTKALLAVCLARLGAASFLTLPVTHDPREPSRENVHDHASRSAVEQDLFAPPAPFWYTYMDFGDTKDVPTLIDTGSPWLEITTPYIYKPSAESFALNTTHSQDPLVNQTAWKGYSQTKRNGCGGIRYLHDVYSDTVIWGNLTVHNQRFGVADYTKTNRTDIVNVLPPPYQALAGLTIGDEDQIGNGGKVLMSNLYQSGQIDEPRFGLALGTNGTGSFVLGGVDHSLFDGDLTHTPVVGGQWMVLASLTSEGSKLVEQQTLWLDSGGPSITGTNKHIRALFEDAGIQAVETNTTCGPALYGYYPCDRPPKVGFEIGGTNFDIEPSALRWKDDGANNCTAIIVGHPPSAIGGATDFWIVGQSFMQGKYLDHNGKNKVVGFAKLKNAADPASREQDDMSSNS